MEQKSPVPVYTDVKEVRVDSIKPSSYSYTVTIFWSINLKYLNTS